VHVTLNINIDVPSGSVNVKQGSDSARPEFMNEADKPSLANEDSPAVERMKGGEDQQFEARVASVSNLNRTELAEDKSAFREVSEASALATRKQQEETKARQAKGEHLSKTNEAEYRKWRKEQVYKKRNWSQKMYDRLMQLPEANGTRRENMKEVFMQINQVHDALAVIKDNIEMVSSTAQLEEYASVTENSKKLGRRLWNEFRSKVYEQEKQCVVKNQAQEKQSMEEANMKSKEEIAAMMTQEPAADESDEMHEKDMEQVIETEMSKAEGVLDKTEAKAVASENKLEKEVNELTSAGEEMQKSLESGRVNEEAAKMVEAQMEDIAGIACEAKEGWVVRKLKEVWHSLKSAADVSTPTLGIRGMGGTASVLGGGVEEVIDFWNKEIGLFRYGAFQVGSSSLSVGVGGYAGVGWKGYKLDWNLEEAYQTATFTARSGFTFAVDADNSAGSPWIPEPHGTNGVVVGWGVSMGPSLPLGFDVGQALYSMFTSECFHDYPLWKFLGMMWLPHCLNCTGVVERTVMDGMRLGIKAASFPGITDVIHSLLAIRVHHLRQSNKVPQCRTPDGWKECPEGVFNPNKPEAERCSPRSTRQRDSRERLFDLAMQRLQESTQLLNDVVTSYGQLMENLKAKISDDPDTLRSQELVEFWEKMKDEDVSCLRSPRERTTQLAGEGSPLNSPKLTEAFLSSLSKEELVSTCIGIDECKDEQARVYDTTESLIPKILKAQDAAAGENSFGLCSTSEHCYAAVEESPFVKSLTSQWLSNKTACSTVGQDAESFRHGPECVFPFKYNGVSYNSCIKADQPSHWCYTQVDAEGNGVRWKWGNCADDCPKFDTMESRQCGCSELSTAQRLACRVGGDARDCSAKCPGLSGTCNCRKGFCFERTAHGATCVKDRQTPSSLGLEGLKAGLSDWVRAREFELGSAFKTLKEVSGLESGEKAW